LNSIAKLLGRRVGNTARMKLIYLASAVFLCRKPAALGGRPSPARENPFRDALDAATERMRRIEARFPAPPKASVATASQ
jgi:hypothetical protein